jgi:hypothetical protein
MNAIHSLLVPYSIGKVMINAAIFKGLKVTLTPNQKALLTILMLEETLTKVHLSTATDQVLALKSAIEGAVPT